MPRLRMCPCASMKPGTARRPSSSMTAVSGPTRRLISSSVPTATIDPDRAASAETSGCAGSSVTIFPPSSTRSAAGGAAQPHRTSPETTMSRRKGLLLLRLPGHRHEAHGNDRLALKAVLGLRHDEELLL